jgi:hypothetical protein
MRWSGRSGGARLDRPRSLDRVSRCCNSRNASFAKRPVASQQPGQLFIAEPLEELRETLTASLVDLAEDIAARIRRVDEHDPTIVAAMPPLDQTALLHATHDPGHACDRDVERLCQMAHGVGTIRIDDREDIEVDEAERVPTPAPEGNDELAWAPGQELVQECIGEPSTAIRPSHVRRRRVDIQ